MARKEGWKEDGAMLGPEAEKEEGETAEGEAGGLAGSEPPRAGLQTTNKPPGQT